MTGVPVKKQNVFSYSDYLDKRMHWLRFWKLVLFLAFLLMVFACVPSYLFLTIQGGPHEDARVQRGDLLFVTPLSYIGQHEAVRFVFPILAKYRPKKDDLIVFKSPGFASRSFLGRIIGRAQLFFTLRRVPPFRNSPSSSRLPYEIGHVAALSGQWIYEDRGALFVGSSRQGPYRKDVYETEKSLLCTLKSQKFTAAPAPVMVPQGFVAIATTCQASRSPSMTLVLPNRFVYGKALLRYWPISRHAFF